MKLSLARIILIVLIATSQSAFAEREKVSQIRLPENLTKEQYKKVYELGVTFDHCGGDHLFVDQEQLAELKKIGVAIDVELDDVSSFYQSRNTQGVPFGGFRTYSEIVAYLDSMTAAHPTIMGAKFSIGTSLEGRNLWVVKISDNPAVDENEPELFYNSLIHAREPASAASLMYFMDYLLSNYGTITEVTNLVDNREFFFLLVVNPDGYVYNETNDPLGGGMWRKNRRNNGANFGVDLNRNYGFEWGIDDVGSSGATNGETYRGPSAFSEPETKAIRDFVYARNFVIVHNVHTYSNLYLWPWGGSDRSYSHVNEFYIQCGDSMSQGNTYTPQVGWELYPTNGAADDWCWGDTTSKERIISFTTEIGANTDGFWPSPSRIPTLVSENLTANLFLARIADNPYVLGIPDPPVVTLPDSVLPDFQINWAHADSINPASSYRVVELRNRSTITDNAESSTSNNYWSSNRFARTTARFHSGTWSWTTQDVNFAPHWLVGKDVYEVKPNDSLIFWVWYNVENNYDYFYAQVSVDGGYKFYNLPGNLTTNTDPFNINLGNGMTGNSSGWQRATFSLAPYVGKEVVLRLAYFTDQGTLGEGVYVDDIQNVEQFGITTELASGVPDTSYDVSGRAPGDYWYKVTATDAQNQESRYSRREKTTVKQTYLVGDVNADNMIDIADLTSLIDYMFLGGPTPNPLNRANTDCLAGIDISDLTRLIDYLFITFEPISCS